MKDVGYGRITAVADHLTSQQATIREIMAATGYSRSSVESALAVLRKDRAPELANLMRDRKGPRPKVPNHPSPISAALREKREEADPVVLVHRALASRSALEQAWR